MNNRSGETRTRDHTYPKRVFYQLKYTPILLNYLALTPNAQEKVDDIGDFTI